MKSFPPLKAKMFYLQIASHAAADVDTDADDAFEWSHVSLFTLCRIISLSMKRGKKGCVIEHCG